MDRYCKICRNTACINHGKDIVLAGEGWQCDYIPVPTNADRIRAMSDEELAKECVRQFPMYLWPTEVRTIYFDFENHNKNKAINAWLQWLQQPAEGD